MPFSSALFDKSLFAKCDNYYCNACHAFQNECKTQVFAVRCFFNSINCVNKHTNFKFKRAFSTVNLRLDCKRKILNIKHQQHCNRNVFFSHYIQSKQKVRLVPK